MRILSIQLSLLSLVLVLTSTLAKVIVYAPKELRKSAKSKKRDDDPFKISLANFGVIPYGHSLIGRIYYDIDNADGCQSFGDFDFSKDEGAVAAGQTAASLDDEDFGARFGAGLNFQLSPQVTGSFEGYTVEFRDDYEEYTFSGGLRVNF